MAGLEILGAVGVSLQLVKVAESCLSIVFEVRRIPQLAREQNDAHLSLLFEALKFESWCATSGIQDMIEASSKEKHVGHQQNSESPAQSSSILASRLLGEGPLIPLTLTALKNMKLKLTEATGIISRYATTSSLPKQPSSDASLQSTKGEELSKWARLRKKEPKLSLQGVASSSNAMIEHRPSPVSDGGSSVVERVKWVTSDKGRMDKLLRSIHETNDLLAALTSLTDQAHMNRQTEMKVLDFVDPRTFAAAATRPDLKDMARIKHWQKQERTDNQGDDSSSTFSITAGSTRTVARVHTYQVGDFQRGSLPPGDYRVLTTLEEKQVMVEWKYYNREQPIRLERTMRLGGLVGLMNRNQLFKKFMALPCKGLVHDTQNSRIGVVFTVEEPSDHLGSLYALIHDTPTPAPLGQRYDLAKRLVTAVHHLHSVDWLHKSIQSDNIVCCWGAEPEPQMPHSPETLSQATDQNPSDIKRRPLPSFYLVGWDLSRPDHPSELSESLSISTTGFRNRRDANLLYSHPETHVTSRLDERPRFCAQYDIYSLGLVLLEIGLWQTLDMIRSPRENDGDFRTRLCQKYCDKLLYKTGEIYWRVVRRCLTNDFGGHSGEGAEDGGFSLQVAFEKLVVSELDRCFA